MDGNILHIDSNVDCRQGLKELNSWTQRHNFVLKCIYLSYSGVDAPKYYGIKYRPVGFISNLTYEERIGDV